MHNIQNVVIIGWNEFARKVSKEITTAGKAITVISNNKHTVEGINSDSPVDNITAIYSDFYDFKKIKEVNIESALAVLINLEDDTEKLKYIISFNKHFNNNQTVVPINNANLKETFCNAGVRYPLSKNEVAAKIISGFLFEKDVSLYCRDLLSSAENGDDYDIQQYKVLPDSPFCNVKYGKAFRELREDYNAILIGLGRRDKDLQKKSVLKNPPDSTVIDEGDYLILILNGDTAAKLSERLNVNEGVIF